MKRLSILLMIIFLAIGLSSQDNEYRFHLGDLLKAKNGAGLPLPYIAGQYLTNDGTSLSWGAVSVAGFIKADGTVELTNNWDAGPYEIRALKFYADQTTGTAPFTVSSTTAVTNLNADLVDAIHGTDLVKRDGSAALTANWPAGTYYISSAIFLVNLTDSATQSLSAAQCYKGIISNALCTQNAHVDLPAAVAGMSITVYVKAAWTGKVPDIGAYENTSNVPIVAVQ